LSGYEGLTPGLRVSSNNPPYKMHALIVDYDEKCEDIEEAANEIKELAKKKGFTPPTAIGNSWSGNLRTIYWFEAPILVHEFIHRKLIDWLAKELRLDAVHEGLDKPALRDTSLYFSAPFSWVGVSQGVPVSSNMLNHGLVEVSSRAAWKKTGAPVVPIELVTAAVQEKFAGKWPGTFEIGARGPRFWDDTANNPTAAIVRETGMQCFTGPRAFVTWAEIFGQSFVRDFETQRIGGAIEETYFDGQMYWRLVGSIWLQFNRQDTILHLRSGGLTQDAMDGNLSELEKALVTIQTTQRVDAAVPLPHFPAGINVVHGRHYLNTARCEVITPIPEKVKWGEGFKRLSEYLGTLFAETETQNEQRTIYLAWLKRYYLSCLNKKPIPGQVMFIAGDVEQGKTFLSNVVMAKMLGGHCDASSWLLGETGFSGHLIESPLWTVDDTKPGQERAHANYSSMVKKMAANQSVLYNEKYRAAKMVPWLGRIVVTCNLDNESLRILPDVETSILDKIILTKVRTREGVDFAALAGGLSAELPHFCAWLRDWDPEDDLEGVTEKSRYGVTSYHHPELLQAAKEGTTSHAFLELFMNYLQEFWDSAAEEWIGNATSLIKDISADDTLRPIINQYTSRAVGRALSQLQNQGFPLTQFRDGGLRWWKLTKIDYDSYRGIEVKAGPRNKKFKNQ
jgi:hypothetical protein